MDRAKEEFSSPPRGLARGLAELPAMSGPRGESWRLDRGTRSTRGLSVLPPRLSLVLPAGLLLTWVCNLRLLISRSGLQGSSFGGAGPSEEGPAPAVAAAQKKARLFYPEMKFVVS